MCDDSTERDVQKYLAEKRLKRRAFNVGVGATAAVLMVGCDSEDDPVAADAGDKNTDAGAKGGDAGTKLATKSSSVEIETPDGTIDAFFVHPETGKHAAVIIWPDILGPRAAFETMSTRLAESGYAVVVTNQYYRSAKAPVLEGWAEWQSDAGKAKVRPMIEKLTPTALTSDAAALVEWLDKQSAVDTSKRIGTAGYCLGGPFTFRTAASKPERVGAFASFHGAGLVTDEDSPHLLLPNIQAMALIAIAEDDDKRDPDVKTVLKEAAEEADVKAEIEVYPAPHGWCAIDSAAYDEEQADKAWARMLAIFEEALA
jgi:carboxymethylenebutenolidase